MTLLIVILFSYIFVTLFGYIVHWSLHQPWMGRFNKSHMRHHLILYPPEDYYSETYRDAGADSTTKFFVAVSVPVVTILILVLSMIGLPLSVIILALCEVALLGWLHDYVHDAFHISDHWLSKYSFFKKLDALHFNHHADMSKNFGIYVFHWDKVFKTFKK